MSNEAWALTVEPMSKAAEFFVRRVINEEPVYRGLSERGIYWVFVGDVTVYAREAVAALLATLDAERARLSESVPLDVEVLADALGGFEVVPYKPFEGDDYELHRRSVAKLIAREYATLREHKP